MHIFPDFVADAAVQKDEDEEGNDVDGDREERDVQGSSPGGGEMRPAVVDSGVRLHLCQSGEEGTQSSEPILRLILSTHILVLPKPQLVNCC